MFMLRSGFWGIAWPPIPSLPRHQKRPLAPQNLLLPTLSLPYRSCPGSSWHFYTWDAALSPGQESRPQRPKACL